MVVAAPAERIPGKYERLCWERQARDLAIAYPDGLPANDDPATWQSASRHPAGFWFNLAAAQRPVAWIEALCHHHKGEWAGQRVVLSDWQRQTRRIVFGWMRADETRRFRVAYFELPRKNGKTTDAAAGALYLAFGDGEPGADCYVSATKKDQAKICHGDATAMVRRSPELREIVRGLRNNLHDPETGSKFEPLGADSSTLDGLNPHGNIIDELHAHRDRTLWDVLDTAMGARRQPLTWAITTAGLYDPETIGWIQHQHAIQVLEGTIEDDAFFAFIAAADPEDDWTAPATWWKANPNLGVSLKWEYLEAQCRKAQQQPSFLNTFLRLHLNRWTQQQDRWIPIEAWNASEAQDLTVAEARTREAGLLGRPCYGGLDLSTKLDISACLLAFPGESDTVDLVCRFWVPEERIQERVKRDRVPYDAWVRDGWLITTPGNVIDYDSIRAEIRRLAATYDLRELGFDPWNATQLAVQLQGDGVTMVEVRQGYQTLSEPSKAFEARVVARTLRHMGHPVLRWMVSNVAVREDPAGNIKPDKSASTERIDGVAAAIMALSRLIVTQAGSVYDERPPLVFG